MTVASLRAKVEARVQGGIVLALFNRAKAVHAKRAWRHCPCDYCVVKRRFTESLSLTPLHIPREDREFIRETRRVFSRERLAEEFQ
jgi:hypothetical protein